MRCSLSFLSFFLCRRLLLFFLFLSLFCLRLRHCAYLLAAARILRLRLRLLALLGFFSLPLLAAATGSAVLLLGFCSRPPPPPVTLTSESTEAKDSLKSMQSSDSSNEEGKFKVRKLEITDKSKGFIELLSQLSVCVSITDKQFEDRFQELSSYGDDHIVCVIEDEPSMKIIATGSIFIEKKFMRNCGKVGHIEDVVVDSNARGKQLGKKIVEFLTDHAQAIGCYKVILDCSVNNRAFYEKCGYKQKEIQMAKYFV